MSYANERRESRPVAGPVTIHIGDRFMITEGVVGPPLSEPLIGQIVLEAPDLIEPTARIGRSRLFHGQTPSPSALFLTRYGNALRNMVRDYGRLRWPLARR